MPKLYYYVNLSKPELRGWFKDKNGLRAKFSKQCAPADVIIRTAHVDIDPPKGYHKPNGHLACDAIEPIPTMRSLIHALTH